MFTFLTDFIVKIPKKKLKCKVKSQLEDNVRNRLNTIFSRNENLFIDQITIPH